MTGWGFNNSPFCLDLKVHTPNIRVWLSRVSEPKITEADIFIVF